MKTKVHILLLLAIFAAMAPRAICQDKPVLKSVKASSGDATAEAALPPTPYEFDITEAVFTRFPDANRSEVDRFLHDNFADELQKFRALAVDHQSEATELFSNLVREALSLLDTRRKNPAAFENKLKLRRLEAVAARLSKEICLADSGKKQQLRENLRATATSIFDIKQELMKADIEQMSKDLALLKDMVSKREANRDAIVERRVTDLSRDREDMEW